MESQSINLKIPVPRGMLFLYDISGSNIEIPAYSEAEIIAFTKNAISIATISDLDGDTVILLTNMLNKIPAGSVEIYSGQIFLETGTIHVCLMGDESIAHISAEEGINSLKIFSVDNKQYPDSIIVLIGTES